MHRNYFLFENQVEQLSTLILNKHVIRVFTYKKNELVIDLESIWLTISIDHQYPFILTNPPSKIKSHKLDIFGELNGEILDKISIVPFDKYITLYFNQYKIDAAFYGKYPNIFLKNLDSQQISKFKDTTDLPEVKVKKARYDLRKMELQEFKALIESAQMQTLAQNLIENFAGINKIFLREISHRIEKNLEKALTEYSSNDLKIVFEHIKIVFEEVSEKKIYLNFINRQISCLSLIPMTHLLQSEGHHQEIYESTNEGWQRFIYYKKQAAEFATLQKKCITALNKRLKFLKLSLEKISAIEDISQKKAIAELKGNLLLTYQSTIQPNLSKVLLKNIFSETQEDVLIKLDPRKSIIENATQYFKKYKDIGTKRYAIETKKFGYVNELEKVTSMKTELQSATRYSKLNHLFEILVDMKVLQSPHPQRKTDMALQYSFSKFIFDNKWVVYVGKSGQNNDLLTFSFAHKWDIWFHAQGVAGAHVLLRLPSKEMQPPADIIEKTAQLAAANSKSRHSETVPVVYTLAKHVHRIRKAPPGTVRLMQENVIFVKPLETV